MVLPFFPRNEAWPYRPPSRRRRTRAAARRALAAGEVAVAPGELLRAALRVAAVPAEPELDEPLAGADPNRADPASAPPAPKSITMTSPAATYKALRRRAKCCVSAFIP